MSYTATYTYGTDSGDYPWMQSLAAFGAPGELLSSVSSTPFSSTVSVTALYAGALLIVEQYVGYNTGEPVPGPYGISDGAANDWISLCSEGIAGGGADGTTWWLQVWYCIANEASTAGTEITVAGPPSDEYYVAQQGNVTQFIAATDGTYMGPFVVLALATYNTSTDPPVSGPPSLSVTATNPQLLYSSAIALNGPSGSLGAVSPFTLDWNAVDSDYFVAAGEYEVFDDSYVPPPPIPLPLRYKKLPLSLDFANCTWDQQNRLLMYELYRSCGLDPANAYLQSLYDWLDDWIVPVTITVTVWSEAVDPTAWTVLKQVMQGQVVTLDPSVSEEWAAYGYPGYEGQYEVMQKTYNPFQGDASQFANQAGGDPSTVVGSATLASPANTSSGTIVLQLRTYNPFCFFDVSQTPSYANVPGPIIGDPLS